MTDEVRFRPLPPRRRPGPIAVAVRWRVELAIVAIVAAAWHFFGGTAVGITAPVLALLVTTVPALRRRFRGWLQAVVAMHRVRSGLVQAGVADRAGRLPWVVAARPLDDTVRVTRWLRSGTPVGDVERALPVITSACGATHVELVRHAPRQDRVALLVARPRWGWWTR